MFRLRLWLTAAVLFAPWLAAALWAAPPLSTIQDVLYKADGTKFNGIAVVEWNSFQASDSSNIATHNVTVRIVDGILRVRLVPTTTASAGARYVVRYNSDGKVQFNEVWSVPPSTAPLRLADVRMASSSINNPVADTLIEIADVDGLATELGLRPVKGPGYVPSSAAVIGPTGQIESAMGSSEECVRVDGTAGPCGGAGTMFTGGFVDGEEPSGVLDGVNATFTLAAAPTPGSSLALYRNGLLQRQGLDYTVSGSTVVFEPVAIPLPQDILQASYRLVDPASAAGAVQVLCIASGTATSATVLGSLGQCAIAGGLLKAGDRIEIRFDYAHTGATAGFSAEVRWGSTALVARSAGAAETLFTGRADASIYGSGAQWTAQSWGTSLALVAGAGDSPEAGLMGATIDFLGKMAAATSDTLALRNFAVLRYPAP